MFDAEDTLSASLAAMATVVETLAFDTARSTHAASGFMLATDAADFLVGRGVPFRTAHEVVGAMVRQLTSVGRDLASLSTDEWRHFSPLFDERVHEAVSGPASVRARRTPQSTAPDAVRAALDDARRWLEHERITTAG